MCRTKITSYRKGSSDQVHPLGTRRDQRVRTGDQRSEQEIGSCDLVDQSESKFGVGTRVSAGGEATLALNNKITNCIGKLVLTLPEIEDGN